MQDTALFSFVRETSLRLRHFRYFGGFRICHLFNAQIESPVIFTNYRTAFLTFDKKHLGRAVRNFENAARSNVIVFENVPIGNNASKDEVEILSAGECSCKSSGAPPKKLQRLLAEEGATYSELLDQVRSNLAKRPLAETDISIDRIAKTLDYSTDWAFSTAAKRWFGKTPTQYRKHVRGI